MSQTYQYTGQSTLDKNLGGKMTKEEAIQSYIDWMWKTNREEIIKQAIKQWIEDGARI